MNEKVKRTERGWPGHFIAAYDCAFRRNTLLECGERAIVVSTVGNYAPQSNGGKEIVEIGHERWFETMAFEALEDGPYLDSDVTKQIEFDSEWAMCGKTRPDHVGVDKQANDMHEAVVAELTATLAKGETNE